MHTLEDGPAPQASLLAFLTMDECGPLCNHHFAALVGSGELNQITPRPPEQWSPVFHTACACDRVGSACAWRAAHAS